MSNNIIKHQVETPLISHFLPQSFHVSPTVVKTKDGEYQVLVQLDGIPFKTVDDNNLEAEHNSLCNWIKTISNGDYAVTGYRVNKPMQTHFDAEYKIPFAKKLSSRYYNRFKNSDSYITQFYLVLHYLPLKDNISKMSFKSMSKLDIEKMQNSYIKDIEDRASQMVRTLKSFNPVVKGMYEKDHNLYSYFYNFLSYLVNGKDCEIPVTEHLMHESVAYSTNTFKQDFRAITSLADNKYAAYVEIFDYPEKPPIGALDKLLQLQCEFVEVFSFEPLNGLDAQKRLDRLEGHAASSGKLTDYERAAFYRATENIKSGDAVFGNSHYVIALFGNTIDEVKIHKKEILALMAEGAGFQAVPIELISPIGFFSSIMGNWKYRSRKSFLSHEAFFGLFSLHNYSTGKKDGNPWGEFITAFQTPNKKPFYFNFHATPDNKNNENEKHSASTIITGDKGSGKTVIEAFAITMATKVDNLRLCFYDKDQGVRILVCALGGIYRVLRIGQDFGFNPFYAWQASESTYARLMVIIEMCIKYSAGQDYHVTVSQKEQIREALQSMYKNLDRVERSFTTFLQNIQSTDSDVDGKEGLRELLKPFTRGDRGELGEFWWLLDSPIDKIDYSNNAIFGYDYTELLDSPLNAIVLYYLMQREAELKDGSPQISIFAEAWKALDNPVLVDFIRDASKTDRKGNWFLVMDSQEPADFLKSKYGETIAQQTATKICGANREAVWEHYEKLGFTRKEFETIRSFDKFSRNFLIKQEGQSAVVQLDLHGFDYELVALSGDKVNNQIFIDLTKDGENLYEGWYDDLVRESSSKKGVSARYDHISIDLELDALSVTNINE
jgi:type IV secretion system protein VirB4